MAGLWFLPPRLADRVFPITTSNGSIYALDIAYPLLEPVFSSALAGVLAAVIPIAVFLIAQLHIRSFANFGSAILGLGYSMVTGCCAQVILKKSIGGFRPHFLEACKPIILPETTGQGFHKIMYTPRQVCTGNWKEVKNALESFPSGHANIAFSAFGFLSIYLFSHLRISSGVRSIGYWRMVAVVAPLLFAVSMLSKQRKYRARIDPSRLT